MGLIENSAVKLPLVINFVKKSYYSPSATSLQPLTKGGNGANL